MGSKHFLMGNEMGARTSPAAGALGTYGYRPALGCRVRVASPSVTCRVHTSFWLRTSIFRRTGRIAWRSAAATQRRWLARPE